MALIGSPNDGIIQFRLDATPYPDDPPHADAFYRELGTYIVAWGRFEGHFLGCLLMIRDMPGAPSESGGFPVSWKRRAEYWRQSFKTMPVLQPCAHGAGDLITDIMERVVERSGIVHTLWRGFVSHDPLTIEALVVRPAKSGVVIERLPITVDQIKEARLAADMLSERLSHTTRIVAGLRTRPTKGPIF